MGIRGDGDRAMATAGCAFGNSSAPMAWTTTVVPCTQVYLTLELAHGGELVGQFVYTRHLKKDVMHYCYCHLILDS
jgi:hypothetical protein